MWRLVEIMERCISLNVMQGKEINNIMSIIMITGEKKYLTRSGWFGNYYHPCGETHEAEEDTGFISGYIDDQSTRQDEKIPVVIWTNNGTDVHCTTKLDMSTWETTKS